MCVEEFGAVCSLPGVVRAFGGYFDPAGWSESDASPIPFAKPKCEVINGMPHERPVSRIFDANGRPVKRGFTGARERDNPVSCRGEAERHPREIALFIDQASRNGYRFVVRELHTDSKNILRPFNAGLGLRPGPH